MVTVYQLRRDKQRIEAVQKATLTTWKFGVMRTHGLFGSEEWWQKIKTGKLRVHHLSGAIKRLDGRCASVYSRLCSRYPRRLNLELANLVNTVEAVDEIRE
jgi:hypothetical protein